MAASRSTSRKLFDRLTHRFRSMTGEGDRALRGRPRSPTSPGPPPLFPVSYHPIYTRDLADIGGIIGLLVRGKLRW